MKLVVVPSLRSLSLAISALISSVIMQAADAAPRKTEQVFVLTQQDIILGHVKAYVGKSGVKITMDAHNCVLVASPPTWKLSYFNPTSKLIHQRDFDSLKKYPIFAFEPEFTQSLWKPGTQTVDKDHGFPAVKIERDCNVRLEEGMFQAYREKPRIAKKATYYAYIDKDKQLPPDSVRFLETLGGYPHMGLPLALYYCLQDRGHRNAVMVTYDIKTETIPISEFEPPKGYKQAKSELDVANDNRTQLMDVWIDDMGLGDKPGAKKSEEVKTKSAPASKAH